MSLAQDNARPLKKPATLEEDSSSKELKATTRSSVQQNDAGFLKLPVEILTIHIVEYIPNVPFGIPHELRQSRPGNPTGPLLEDVVLERHKVLRALAQTCRRFRDVFLPLQWETLDFCASPPGFDDRKPWFVNLTKVIERVCEGLLQSPELASYVSAITVTLTRSSYHPALPTLARCMQALPNLQTLQVIHAHDDLIPFMEESFKGFTFPRIRTVFLPAQTHKLLLSCPEVRRVVFTDSYSNPVEMVATMAVTCKNIERLEGMSRLISTVILRDLIKAVPNLKQMELNLEWSDEEQIMALTGLEQLTEINLITYDLEPHEALQAEKANIDAAREVLRKSSAPKEEKMLRIRCGMEVEPYRWPFERTSKSYSGPMMIGPRWVRVIEI
ncbi:hypothetical protein V5O48_001264 [Marasmius crinis-equi]|uniref:F-box domain-containing protein n=1 Tax=Marasmius crinis-equi TaxID=585013 RepID=A0ABR3FZ15_9AGAR